MHVEVGGTEDTVGLYWDLVPTKTWFQVLGKEELRTYYMKLEYGSVFWADMINGTVGMLAAEHLGGQRFRLMPDGFFVRLTNC